MGYRCRKCGLLCCSKRVKDVHEAECKDVIWSIQKKHLNTYDHNYTFDLVLPDFLTTKYSNWEYLQDVEHNYCFKNERTRPAAQSVDICIGNQVDTSTHNNDDDKDNNDDDDDDDNNDDESNVWNVNQSIPDHTYSKPSIRFYQDKKCQKCGKKYRYDVFFQKHISSCHKKGHITCRTCNLVCSSHKELYSHKMQKHHMQDKAKLQNEPWGDKNNAPWVLLRGLEKERLKNVYDLHRSIILAPNQVSDIVSIYNMPCQNDVNSAVIMDKVKNIYYESRKTFKISFSAGLILQHIITGEYRYWKPYRNQEFFSDPFLISSHNDLHDLKEILDTFDLHEYTLKQRPDTKFKCILITNIQMFVFETSYTLGYEAIKLPSYLTQNKHILCFDKMKQGKYKKPYKDFLCAFRCIAYHKRINLYKISTQKFELYTLRMFKKWRTFMFKKCCEHIQAYNFRGISTNDLKLFEECFSVSINVFEKKDKDIVIPIYKSLNNYSDRMCLNIYKNHLSYITNFKCYAKKFKCNSCDKLFSTLWHLTRHSDTCLTGSKIKFRGGLFYSNRDIWDELELFGLNIANDDKHFTHFIVYDYECLLEKSEVDFGMSTKTESIHKPISVSTSGNCCEKHRKPVCIVEENFDVLIHKWILEIENISEHIRTKTMKKWGGILSSLKELKDRLKPESNINNKEGSDEDDDDSLNMESNDHEEVTRKMTKALDKGNVYQHFVKNLCNDKWKVQYNDWSSEDSDDDDDDDDDEVKYELLNEMFFKNMDYNTQYKMYKQVSKLYDKTFEYINQIPVIGYHSAKYDILVIRSQLIKHLGLYKPNLMKRKSHYVIKRGESYPCIATSKYKFLDITEYIGSHVSYSQFLKSMKVTSGRKLFFPFEAIRSFSDLKNELPEMNSQLWFSSIKQKSLLDDGVDSIETNYKLIKDLWDNNNMKTLQDLLIIYNNSDCGPFITAVESFQKIFLDRGLSVFKSGVISAPGLSRKLLFSTADEQNIPITLFDKKNADLYYSFKKQCYGGASIIFSRHHKVDKTYIRGNPEHICKSIFGIDGVALYLYCISLQMPVGFCIRRKDNNEFRPEISDRAISTIHWLTWQNEYNNKHILHRYNTGGKERSFANFKFDGWDPVDKIGYEMNGCYIHGHKFANKYCFLSKDMDSELAEKRYKQTIDREKYIKQFCKMRIIWECSYYNLAKTNKDLQKVVNKSRPLFYNKHKGRVTSEQILKAVSNDKIFGFIEVDITVNEHELTKLGESGMTKYQYLMEMCPLFGTAVITYDHISGIMKDFINENNISKAPRKQLVGALTGKKIMLHSSLLKFYLEIGLHVTHIHQVVEYVGFRVFKPFSDMVMNLRRQASVDPEKAPLAQMFKIIGNSGMFIYIS